MKISNISLGDFIQKGLSLSKVVKTKELYLDRGVEREIEKGSFI
jgi:hypothetical protein